jgi:hypothetical protein
MAQGAGLEPAQDTINSRAHYLSATPEYWRGREDLVATGLCVVDPPGFEPEFQPSEDCALSIGRRTRNWRPRRDSNPQVSRFVAEYPVQLNDTSEMVACD